MAPYVEPLSSLRDGDDVHPGQVFSERALHNVGPLRAGELVMLRVLGFADPLPIGALYIFAAGDGDGDHVFARLVEVGPDGWTVDEFGPGIPAWRRRYLDACDWLPVAAVTVAALH